MSAWELIYTARQWLSFNPVLEYNQVGRESDTGKTKTGDGTTPWSALPYEPIGGTAQGVIDGGSP